ncbi:MAG: asparagine synthase-related protein [[Clostridium] symbiosum]
MIYSKFFYNVDESFETDYGRLTGCCFLNERKTTLEQLGLYMHQCIRMGEFNKIGLCTNGFFSGIYFKEDEVIAIVDRVRSYPLFYSSYENDLYFSDNPKWIKNQLTSVEWDDKAENEFLLTGYVTGNNTLYHEIKQIQAGELIYINKGNFYNYRYHIIPYKSRNNDIQVWNEEHQKMLITIFNRMVSTFEHSTFVIPLSGGYDSRLIALLLKKVGASKIISFTYGNKDDIEVQLSRGVADALGIDWHHIEYTPQDYKIMLESNEYKEYVQYAARLSSLPHIQDWIAVKKLKEKGIVTKGSVFVPGHLGDVLTGECSDIKPYMYHKDTTIKKGASAIVDYLYTSRLLTKKEINEYINHVSQEMELYCNESINGTILYELWWARERTSKFIVNSVRIYEFFGFKWWLPFCDEIFWEFWSKVPNSLKIDQKLYSMTIIELMNELMGATIPRDIDLDTQRNTIKHKIVAKLGNNQKHFIQFIRNKGKRGYIFNENINYYDKIIFEKTKDFLENKIIYPGNYLSALYYIKCLIN